MLSHLAPFKNIGEDIGPVSSFGNGEESCSQAEQLKFSEFGEVVKEEKQRSCGPKQN